MGIIIKNSSSRDGELMYCKNKHWSYHHYYLGLVINGKLTILIGVKMSPFA
jgi:hypothetical protein